MQYFVHRDGTLSSVDLDEFDTSQLIEERDFYSWKRIPRAQWRLLKREQKARAKQLSHDLMFEQVKRLMG